MSNSKIHKIVGKWNNGIIATKDIPLMVQFYWDRCNWHVGKSRARIKEIREHIADKDLQNQLDNDLYIET